MGNFILRVKKAESQTLDAIWDNDFYPVPYSVIEQDGRLSLHLDQGDYSYSQQRTERFNPGSVVHRGLIIAPLQYGSLVEGLKAYNNRNNLSIVRDESEDARSVGRCASA